MTTVDYERLEKEIKGTQQQEKPMKSKWNTEQILAEAHCVRGEYEHDRRKYRHSTYRTGTMRVPAGLVVEMLGKGGLAAEPLEAKRLREEITNLRAKVKHHVIGMEQGKKWIARAKDAEAKLKAIPHCVENCSPEEWAVIEAARDSEFLDFAKGVERNHTWDDIMPKWRPFYRAILALHEARETVDEATPSLETRRAWPRCPRCKRHNYHSDGTDKNCGCMDVKQDYESWMTYIKGTSEFYSDAEREHVGTVGGVDWGFKKSAVMVTHVQCACGETYERTPGTFVMCECGQGFDFA
ncbi:MAG: hypothetical protein V3W44_11000 [Dehalococcoidales bacterium]